MVAAELDQGSAQHASEPLLELRNASVNYGGIQALRDVDLVVYPGEVVTLIGANGAGKSTTLRAISRLVPLRAGDLVYAGKSLLRERPDAVVKLGIAHAPEGRRILTRLTVEDNLELGAYTRRNRAEPLRSTWNASLRSSRASPSGASRWRVR